MPHTQFSWEHCHCGAFINLIPILTHHCLARVLTILQFLLHATFFFLDSHKEYFLPQGPRILGSLLSLAFNDFNRSKVVSYSQIILRLLGMLLMANLGYHLKENATEVIPWVQLPTSTTAIASVDVDHLADVVCLVSPLQLSLTTSHTRLLKDIDLCSTFKRVLLQLLEGQVRNLFGSLCGSLVPSH